MRIKYRSTSDMSTCDITMNGVEVVEIDGKPYVPPAPEQSEYGWEVEAAFFTMTASTYGYVEEASTTNFNSDKTRRARCKLGFDDQGRVWMADTHAQYLARCLRDYARNWDAISESSRETLKLAAHRLAGPEK